MNNAIHITAADILACVASLPIQTQTYGMPAGQERTVYWSDRWDSEPSC